MRKYVQSFIMPDGNEFPDKSKLAKFYNVKYGAIRNLDPDNPILVIQTVCNRVVKNMGYTPKDIELFEHKRLLLHSFISMCKPVLDEYSNEVKLICPDNNYWNNSIIEILGLRSAVQYDTIDMELVKEKLNEIECTLIQLRIGYLEGIDFQLFNKWYFIAYGTYPSSDVYEKFLVVWENIVKDKAANGNHEDL